MSCAWAKAWAKDGTAIAAMTSIAEIMAGEPSFAENTAGSIRLLVNCPYSYFT